MLKEILDRKNDGMEFISTLAKIKDTKRIGYVEYGDYEIDIQADERNRTLYITVLDIGSYFRCSITVCEFSLLEWIVISSLKRYKKEYQELCVSDSVAKTFYDFCVKRKK